MNDSTRGRHILAGLVGQPAAELYSRLLANGSLPIGHGPTQVDVASLAAQELLDAAVAFRSGQDDGIVRPVAPARALRALLEQRHEELSDLQRRVRDGWKRLETQLPLIVAGGASAANRHGVEILTDGPRISAIVTELYHSPRVEFRGTETGHFPTRPSANRGFVPPAAAIEAGVRYRYLYRASVNNTEWGQQIIRHAMDGGEEIRLRKDMPVKLMMVDSVAALVSVDRSATAAMLIRSSDVLEMLAEWFDLMWDDRLTTNIDGSAQIGLKPDQLVILRMLPSADSDDAIAKSMGTSVTTVRRHVKAIYAALGVNTRFAAGAAAARRGWI